MATPFFYLLFTSLYHQERIDEFIALATTLGTPPNKVFRRVIAPVLLRRSQPTLLLYLLFAFGSYEIPLLIGPSNPRMLSVLAIQKLQMFDLNQVPLAYVINLLYLGIVGLALLLRTASLEDDYA
jgi:putative spermidine/putrescine transport system permease protein